MGFRILLALSFVAVLLHGGQSIQYNIRNNCPTTIWPATQTFLGPQPSSSGFALSPGTSRIIEGDQRWVGRIWARTGCTNDAGVFTCRTGDCGRGTIACNGAGPAPPVTIVNFDIGNGGRDSYSITSVNGYNLPVRITPQATVCPTITCYVNGACPAGSTSTCPSGQNYVITFCP